MNFQDVSELILSGLRIDGDHPFASLPTDNYYSSPFGLRLRLLLSAFTRDTNCLYAAREPITVEAGDREFRFDDPSNCAKSIYEVTRLWLNSSEIARDSSVQRVTSLWTPSAAPSLPQFYAQLNPTTIVFDVEVSDDLEDCFADGFYRHPVITADEDPVLLPDETILLFDRYAQSFMRQDSASDDVGLARLRMIDRQAYEAVMRIRGEYNANFYGTMRLR